ncbi:MAG: glycoside hydrolase family protein, partial [Armatimonadota bacterium]|nr:glycoside hydrolase family protein [Armatimonadota bacterium]
MTVKHMTTGARTALLGLLALTCLGMAAQAAPKTPSKKGFCVVAHPDGKWKPQVVALKAHWFYTWGGDEPAGVPKGVEFVPMDWG